jgi:hypothetical protein
LLPRPSVEDLVEALGKANRVLLSQGITSAVDAGTNMVDLPTYFSGFRKAVDQGVLRIRHTLAIEGLWRAGQPVPPAALGALGARFLYAGGIILRAFFPFESTSAMIQLYVSPSRQPHSALVRKCEPLSKIF